MPLESKKYKISDLSPHLFWDVDRKIITWKDSAKLITERVLQYGKIEDWKILTSIYTKRQLTKITLQIRYLDPKSLSFISLYLNIPKQEFRCFMEKSSTKGHWIY